MPINKLFINQVLQHVVDIANEKCDITDALILKAHEEDPVKAELLSGLLFLFETIQFQKENYIKTNKELNRRNDDLEEFAYITSHDLKSPLRGIYALASFIEEDTKEGNNDAVFDSISLLQDRIIKMENLINALLEYSKASKSDYKYHWIDINTCIEDIKDLLFISENTSIEITSELPKVYGIKTKIFQVFYNLIENAIKYNDKDQIIVTVSAKTKANEIIFYIEDNGSGIDKEYHGKIFEMFQTIAESGKESTGIGLSLVKKIIDMHKGSIHVTSEKHKGSIFEIRLPKQNPSH